MAPITDEPHLEPPQQRATAPIDALVVEQTIRNYIDHGEPPSVRIGRRLRIKRSDFDRLVVAGYSGGAARRQQPLVWLTAPGLRLGRSCGPL